MKALETASAVQDGFSGFLYCPPKIADRTILVLAGDDGNDILSQAFARWITGYQNSNALCISLRSYRHENPGLDLWELDQVESAVQWVRKHNPSKIGILGISMQAVIALSAASRIPGISLVIAFSPCDFLPWGFRHGSAGTDRLGEYPTGNSLLSWHGQPLPFHPSGLEKEEYWNRFQTDSRYFHEIHSKGIFEHSEAESEVSEDQWIPAEKIRGAVVLIGTEDDSMWDASRYIRRLGRRLKQQEFMFPCKVLIYSWGTHLLVPQRMLMRALPVVGGLVPLLFSSGRKNLKACKQARIDLDRKLTEFLQNW